MRAGSVFPGTRASRLLTNQCGPETPRTQEMPLRDGDLHSCRRGRPGCGHEGSGRVQSTGLAIGFAAFKATSPKRSSRRSPRFQWMAARTDPGMTEREMKPPAPSFDAIVAAIEAEGLACRGAFHVAAADAVPPFGDGSRAAILVLVGNAGPGMWSAFAASEEASDGAPNALDRWSRRIVWYLAQRLGGAAHFPFGGPPWLPFIRWAQRAGPVYPSPIGPLVHPDHGLWHAYRGAIAFRQHFDIPPRDDRPSPCETCADRPCLSACPVDAFSENGYDVDGCVAHIASAAGVRCLGAGCLARHACPIGRDGAYGAPQAAFHMRAFVSARRRSTGVGWEESGERRRDAG